MKTRFLSYGAAWLACITMICPAVALGDRAAHAAIQDVELSRTGDLSGQILNRQGLPIGAVALTLNTNSGVLSSQSNQNGEFTFAMMLQSLDFAATNNDRDAGAITHGRLRLSGTFFPGRR